MAEFLETRPLLSPHPQSRFYPKLHCSAAEDEMKGMSPKNRLSDRKKKREKGKGRERMRGRSSSVWICIVSVSLALLLLLNPPASSKPVLELTSSAENKLIPFIKSLNTISC